MLYDWIIPSFFNQGTISPCMGAEITQTKIIFLDQCWTRTTLYLVWTSSSWLPFTREKCCSRVLVAFFLFSLQPQRTSVTRSLIQMIHFMTLVLLGLIYSGNILLSVIRYMLTGLWLKLNILMFHEIIYDVLWFLASFLFFLASVWNMRGQHVLVLCCRASE